MSKDKPDGALGASCLIVIAAQVCRFLVVAALTWAIAVNIGAPWTWGVAVVTWAVLLLLRMAFGGAR